MKNGKKSKKTLGTGEPLHLISALKALADSKAKYVIVGGIASNLHGLSRATKDIDILIPKDIKNTQKILTALENLSWGLSKEITPEQVISKPFTIIGDMPRVDLLLRAGKLTFEKAYENREHRTIDGIKVHYVSLDDLIKSKKTGRPKDEVEIKELQRLKKLNQI